MLFFGVKNWVLTPPRYAAVSGATSLDWDRIHSRSGALPIGLPMRCKQEPGDLILLPGKWGHATINDGFNVGMVRTPAPT